MPSYLITSPDGRKFKVTGDGTKEEALAHFQQQYAAQQPDNSPEARSQRIEALKKQNPGEYDPTSPEWQAKYGAASGGSDYENFMAGAGKSVADMGRGLKQIGVNAGHALGLVSDETQQATQQGIDESKRLDAPLMQTKAGLGGDVAGTLATTLIPGTMAARGAQAAGLARTANIARTFVNPNTFKAAAAVGAAQGALQPVASDESRLGNAAVGAAGGVTGTGIGKAIGAVAQPVTKVLSAATQKAVDVLEKAGVPLDLAQKTGSRVARSAKLLLADNPVVGPGNFPEVQKASYNRAILRTVGEDADAATPEVMGRVQQRLGGIMDQVAERNPIKYDGTLEVKLANISSNARKELEDSQFGVIKNQLDEVLNKAATNGEAIDGKAYQNIKQQLDRISMGSDQSKGHYARQIREALDEALERSAKGDDFAAIKDARKMYRRMKQIEPAIANDGSGDISAAKLANSLGTKKNAAQSKYGKGDRELVRLAQAGKAVLPEKVGNSGTTARAAAHFLAPGALAAGASFANDHDPTKALEYGLAGVAAPYAARTALQNPRVSGYLANGLGNPMARSILSSPQQQMMVGGPLKHALITGGLGRLNAPQ
jgi:hypothetical protein